MPAGNVRPRASQAPSLGAGAVADYRARGWTVTPHGRVDSGDPTGPCVTCEAATTRYGPAGRPECAECRPPRRDGVDP